MATHSLGSPWKPDRANGADDAENRGAFRRQQTRMGCNSPRAALTHRVMEEKRAFFTRRVTQS
jgi:hypothetical protein